MIVIQLCKCYWIQKADRGRLHSSLALMCAVVVIQFAKKVFINKLKKDKKTNKGNSSDFDYPSSWTSSGRTMQPCKVSSVSVHPFRRSCTYKTYGQAWVQTPSKAPGVFLSEKLLPSLLSTGWFQEQIQACFHSAHGPITETLFPRVFHMSLLWYGYIRLV